MLSRQHSLYCYGNEAASSLLFHHISFLSTAILSFVLWSKQAGSFCYCFIISFSYVQRSLSIQNWALFVLFASTGRSPGISASSVVCVCGGGGGGSLGETRPTRHHTYGPVTGGDLLCHATCAIAPCTATLFVLTYTYANAVRFLNLLTGRIATGQRASGLQMYTNELAFYLCIKSDPVSITYCVLAQKQPEALYLSESKSKSNSYITSINFVSHWWAGLAQR